MKVTKLLKIGIQANWDKNYFTPVGYFSNITAGWKVSHSVDSSR